MSIQNVLYVWGCWCNKSVRRYSSNEAFAGPDSDKPPISADHA